MSESIHKNILAVTPQEIEVFINGVCSTGAKNQTGDEECDVADSPQSSFTAGLVDDFFPDMKHSVQSRMMANPIAKLALGKVCADIVPGQGSAFFECGSTIALAVLAMRNSLRLSGSIQSQIALSTNSALVQTALYGLGESIPRLLYGDRFLNAQKYLGFFPIHPRTIQSAIDGSNAAKSQLQDTWQLMCRDGASFDVSLLTASKFHFICGPFVGSIDNSFLKYAFYSSARDLRILIDGSKCLKHRNLPTEWKKKDCFESMRGVGYENVIADFIAKLFPKASRTGREKLMLAIENAISRNPQASVSLPPVFVERKSHPGKADTSEDMTEEIRVVDSWLGCVEQVLVRRGGAVTVHIAEPDGSPDFEKQLLGAIVESNVTLRTLRSSLRIGQPECSVVYVHKPTRSIREDKSAQCQAVRIWRCVYQMHKGERITDGRTAASITV